MRPAVGDVAPGFALVDEHGTPVSLLDFRGVRPVLLVFFPWAFSGICGGELAALRDAADPRVQVLGISCDAMFSLRTWADAESFGFPLLSDHWPHGAVASAYGVFDATAGVALRGSFLVDVDGILRWSVVQGIGEPRDMTMYADALAALT